MLTTHTHNSMGRQGGRRAFTLAELLIVIAIIVLLIALAVPLLRVLSGNRSQTAAANQIAGMLGEARLKALALQRPVGVFFYHDPASDRYAGVLVGEDDDIEDPNALMLDVLPDVDPQLLTVGVGVQFMNGPEIPLVAGAAPDTEYDKYVSFGLILFDSRGEVITQEYAVDKTAALAQFMGRNAANAGFPDNSAPPVFSQFGFALFDRPAFLGMGFNDGDFDYENTPKTQEFNTEEPWLTVNSLPYTINRYTGTLIKAE